MECKVLLNISPYRDTVPVPIITTAMPPAAESRPNVNSDPSKRTVETKREKSESDEDGYGRDGDYDGSKVDGDANKGNWSSRHVSSKLGRKGDPRMHRAVMARMANPDLSLLDALR